MCGLGIRQGYQIPKTIYFLILMNLLRVERIELIAADIIAFAAPLEYPCLFGYIYSKIFNQKKN